MARLFWCRSRIHCSSPCTDPFDEIPITHDRSTRSEKSGIPLLWFFGGLTVVVATVAGFYLTSHFRSLDVSKDHPLWPDVSLLDASPSQTKSVWISDYGEVVLYENPEGFVRETYTYENGEIRGKFLENELHGIWRQTAESDVACTTAIEGSIYWGRLVFSFNSDFTAFEGQWGSCDTAPQNKWNGTRQN